MRLKCVLGRGGGGEGSGAAVDERTAFVAPLCVPVPLPPPLSFQVPSPTDTNTSATGAVLARMVPNCLSNTKTRTRLVGLLRTSVLPKVTVTSLTFVIPVFRDPFVGSLLTLFVGPSLVFSGLQQRSRRLPCFHLCCWLHAYAA